MHSAAVLVATRPCSSSHNAEKAAPQSQGSNSVSSALKPQNELIYSRLAQPPHSLRKSKAPTRRQATISVACCCMYPWMSAPHVESPAGVLRTSGVHSTELQGVSGGTGGGGAGIGGCGCDGGGAGERGGASGTQRPHSNGCSMAATSMHACHSVVPASMCSWMRLPQVPIETVVSITSRVHVAAPQMWNDGPDTSDGEVPRNGGEGGGLSGMQPPQRVGCSSMATWRHACTSRRCATLTR